VPSSLTVTVTRSHQGALDVRVEGDWAEAEAEVKAKAAIARNTGHSINVSRSEGGIALAVSEDRRQAKILATCRPNARHCVGVHLCLEGFLGLPRAIAV
jgi:hypothetical protein